jgi:hypothetical protein
MSVDSTDDVVSIFSRNSESILKIEQILENKNEEMKLVEFITFIILNKTI